MPTWDRDKNAYVEEDITDDDAAVVADRREETFRTALLNELSWLTRAVRDLEDM